MNSERQKEKKDKESKGNSKNKLIYGLQTFNH